MSFANSNRIAITRSRTAAEALVEALLERYDGLSLLDSQIVPSDGTLPIYTVQDDVGVTHIQMAGGEDTALLDLVREFATGFLAVKDGTSETQGYEPNQTPMSVTKDWQSDGTGFRD